MWRTCILSFHALVNAGPTRVRARNNPDTIDRFDRDIVDICNESQRTRLVDKQSIWHDESLETKTKRVTGGASLSIYRFLRSLNDGKWSAIADSSACCRCGSAYREIHSDEPMRMKHEKRSIEHCWIGRFDGRSLVMRRGGRVFHGGVHRFEEGSSCSTRTKRRDTRWTDDASCPPVCPCKVERERHGTSWNEWRDCSMTRCYCRHTKTKQWLSEHSCRYEEFVVLMVSVCLNSCRSKWERSSDDWWRDIDHCSVTLIEQVSEYADWSVLDYWNSTQTTAMLDTLEEIQSRLINPEDELNEAVNNDQYGWSSS